MAKRKNIGGEPTLEDAIAYHAEHSPDDGRVKWNPAVRVNKWRGKHFDPGDQLHQHYFKGLPDEEKSYLHRAEQAVAHDSLLYLTYHSKKQEHPGSEVTKESREKEYQGKEREAVGHAVLPLEVGGAFGKKGRNVGHIHGLSGSVVVNNLSHYNRALTTPKGEIHSPYPDASSEKFGQDFHGYLANLNNGYTGDGKEPIKGEKQSEGYVPHQLQAHEADFLNAILHNDTAQWNSENAQAARDLNRKHGSGSYLTAGGEVNPVRHAVDKLMEARGVKNWSGTHLQNAIKTFRTDQIGEMHWDPKKMPGQIRPPVGSGVVNEAFMKEGIPESKLTGGHPRGPKPRIRVQATPGKTGKKTEAPGPGEQLPAPQAAEPVKQPEPPKWPFPSRTPRPEEMPGVKIPPRAPWPSERPPVIPPRTTWASDYPHVTIPPRTAFPSEEPELSAAERKRRSQKYVRQTYGGAEKYFPEPKEPKPKFSVPQVDPTTFSRALAFR